MPRAPRVPKFFNPFLNPRALSDPPPPTPVEWAWLQRTTPREKAVLVAIATAPGSTLDILSQMCCMSTSTVEEAVRELAFARLIYPVWVNDEYVGLAISIACAEEVAA